MSFSFRFYDKWNLRWLMIALEKKTLRWHLIPSILLYKILFHRTEVIGFCDQKLRYFRHENCVRACVCEFVMHWIKKRIHMCIARYACRWSRHWPWCITRIASLTSRICGTLIANWWWSYTSSNSVCWQHSTLGQKFMRMRVCSYIIKSIKIQWHEIIGC